MRWCILCYIVSQDFGRFGFRGIVYVDRFVSRLQKPGVERSPADVGSIGYGVRCWLLGKSEDGARDQT